MMLRLKPYQSAPDTIAGTAVLEHDNGREERVAWIRLPSWGFWYDPCWDEMRWGQRVLIYRGWHGFSIRWRFPPKAFQ